MATLLYAAFVAITVFPQLALSLRVCNPPTTVTTHRRTLTPLASTKTSSSSSTSSSSQATAATGATGATATADALNRTKVSIKSSGTKKRKNKTEEERGGQFSLKRLDERTEYKFSLADSLNSTTLRALFVIQEQVSSVFVKFEKRFESFKLIIQSKVERDIRTTLGAANFITRGASKGGKGFFSASMFDFSAYAVAPPRALPGASAKPDSVWQKIASGLNPFEGSDELIGNFDSATTTKKRLNKLREKKAKRKLLPAAATAADTLYKSVTILPKKLEYDYKRRVVRQEVKRAEREGWDGKFLPNGRDGGDGENSDKDNMAGYLPTRDGDENENGKKRPVKNAFYFGAAIPNEEAARRDTIAEDDALDSLLQKRRRLEASLQAPPEVRTAVNVVGSDGSVVSAEGDYNFEEAEEAFYEQLSPGAVAGGKVGKASFSYPPGAQTWDGWGSFEEGLVALLQLVDAKQVVPDATLLLESIAKTVEKCSLVEFLQQEKERDAFVSLRVQDDEPSETAECIRALESSFLSLADALEALGRVSALSDIGDTAVVERAAVGGEEIVRLPIRKDDMPKILDGLASVRVLSTQIADLLECLDLDPDEGEDSGKGEGRKGEGEGEGETGSVRLELSLEVLLSYLDETISEKRPVTIDLLTNGFVELADVAAGLELPRTDRKKDDDDDDDDEKEEEKENVKENEKVKEKEEENVEKGVGQETAAVESVAVEKTEEKKEEKTEENKEEKWGGWAPGDVTKKSKGSARPVSTTSTRIEGDKKETDTAGAGAGEGVVSDGNSNDLRLVLSMTEVATCMELYNANPVLRSRRTGGGGVTIDTSAEAVDTAEAQLGKFLLLSFDVTLFLLESLVKATVAFLDGRGEVGLKRIADCFYISGAVGQFEIFPQFKGGSPTPAAASSTSNT